MAIRKLPKDVRSLLKSSSTISSYYRAVEELVYNSVDSKADAIAIRINLKEHNIEVIDNGTAITEDDLKSVGLRHMTNKYSNKQDQNQNQYYGHKGIALASLVDISLEVIITTRCEKSQLTYERQFYKGKLKTENKGIGKMRASKGTTVKVEGFMYNLTVRRNSMNILTEIDEIKKCLENIALIHPTISFSLRDDTNNNLLVACHKCIDIRQRIHSLFSDIYEVFEELKVEKNGVKIEGYFCNKLNKSGFVNLQHVYVNKQLLFHSKIHKIINSLVKLKDEGWMDRKIKDMKHKKFTNYVNQEKVDLPYIIIITCPCDSYDLSHVPKKTVVEFHDWDLVTNCLKKLIQFYLEHSVKVLDEHAEIESFIGREQSAGVNLPQDIENNYENVQNINLGNSDSINTNENHVDKFDEAITSLVKRVLKKNNGLFGVSQLKNGVKGKAVKRKIATKYANGKKTPVINKNERTVQDSSKICMNDPGKKSYRRQTRTRKITEQSKILLNNEIEEGVKNRNEICMKPSNVSKNNLTKVNKIRHDKNQALFKRNDKNNVVMKQNNNNSETFGTYSAKKRCNDITKRLKHIMLKRRTEYLNSGIKKCHQRHISMKKNENIKVYEKNNSEWCVQNTSGQMVIHEFIPFEKHMNYRRNLSFLNQMCFRKYSELEPETNYDLLKPMIQENFARNPTEKISNNGFNKESRFLQRKLFDEQEINCGNIRKRPFKFDNCDKSIYAEKTNKKNQVKKIYLTHIFNEPLNHKKVPRNFVSEKNRAAIDFQTSNITILSIKNNMHSSRISESFEPITWCSHEKYNMNKDIHSRLNGNVTNTRLTHREISPIIKPSDYIESVISYKYDENLNNNATKKWGDFKFFEREKGVDRTNKFKKRPLVTEIIRRNHNKLENVKYNYGNLNKHVTLNITKAITESSSNSENNFVFNQNECKEFSVSNRNIFTINCSENATVRNVENSYSSANASQTLKDINFEYKRENSNNLKDIEVLFLSNYAEDDVSDIRKDLFVDQSKSLEAYCVHKHIIPSECCKIIVESSDIFEENALNSSSNLVNTEKQYLDIENDIFRNLQETGSNNLDIINKRNVGIEAFNTEKSIENIQNDETEKNRVIGGIPREIENQEFNNNFEAVEINKDITTYQNYNTPNNIIFNEPATDFQVFKRPNYFPKGMSPIINNKAVKSVTLRNVYANHEKDFQDQYFNESMYEAFVQDVEKHTIAFESDAQKLDKITSDAIHKARLRMRNNLSSMVFHADSIKTLKLLTQLDTKFIAVIIEGERSDERASCLVLFDQHAVHERIRIEALCADYKDGNNWRFSKCDPFFLYMSPLQISQIFHYRDKFSQIGLHFVSNQDTSDNILVVAVPMCVYSKEQKEPGILHDTAKELVLEQLEVLKVTKGIGISNPKTIMDLVNMEACRYAIKFGDQLSIGTCARLLRELSLCAAPFQCAHGRPSMAPIVQIKPPVYQYKVDKTKLKMFLKKKNII